eukprot:scaffold4508_cov228-Pinguiococcus_pyrenoidosus.AAC.4
MTQMKDTAAAERALDGAKLVTGGERNGRTAAAGGSAEAAGFAHRAERFDLHARRIGGPNALLAAFLHVAHPAARGTKIEK